jgi:hypothetical protein
MVTSDRPAKRKLNHRKGVTPKTLALTAGYANIVSGQGRVKHPGNPDIRIPRGSPESAGINPKSTIPVSCLSYYVGHTGIEDGFR